MSDTLETAKRPKVTVNVDTGGIVFFLLIIAVLVFAVTTRAGNEVLCEQGWSPTYIDCAKLAPEVAS